MLGLRKSYQDACQANKAIGLFFATLFICTQVNLASAQAKISDDRLNLTQSFECATEGRGGDTLENQTTPRSKFARQSFGKPNFDKGLCSGNGMSFERVLNAQTLVFFYTSSKFATFDHKLRKSRGPPLTRQ